jgi:hypothetical protein
MDESLILDLQDFFTSLQSDIDEAREGGLPSSAARLIVNGASALAT